MITTDWISIATLVVPVIGVMITLTVKGTKVLGKIETRVELLEDKMVNVHDACSIPRGAMKTVQADIKDLQDKDIKIDLKLTEMNTTLTSTNAMTAAMYKHFFEEGINRRSTD